MSNNTMPIIMDHFLRRKMQEQSAPDDPVGPKIGGPEPTDDPAGPPPEGPESTPPEGAPAPTAPDPEADAAAQAAGLGEEDPNATVPQPDQFAEFTVAYLEALQKYSDQPKVLREALKVARDVDDLSPSQRGFIEMNISAVSLLTESVIVDAQKQVRRNMKDMDVWESVSAQLEAVPELEVAVQRIGFSGPDKSNLLRQLFSVLIGGAVFPGQTGGEVLVLPKGEESPTAFRPKAYTVWGMVDFGPVSLTNDSVQEYLSEAEQEKLKSGAPEERKVLRNRLIIEAISDQLSGGEFIIMVIHPEDGSWEVLRLNSDWFKDAYENGQITVIEASPEPTGDLAVDEDGNFVTMADWGLALINKEEDTVDDSSGEPTITKDPIAIIEGKRLIWTATLDQMEQLGMDVEKHMWKRGNPEELKKQQRNVPDAREKLMKRD